MEWTCPVHKCCYFFAFCCCCCMIELLRKLLHLHVASDFVLMNVCNILYTDRHTHK